MFLLFRVIFIYHQDMRFQRIYDPKLKGIDLELARAKNYFSK
jgi:hypothetical protein